MFGSEALGRLSGALGGQAVTAIALPLIKVMLGLEANENAASMKAGQYTELP